jgi:hypothetical protein
MDLSSGPIPQEAIDYLQAKKLKPGFDYRDVWRDEHAGAFTVAKMMHLDMLSDMRDSLVDALKKGSTLQQWSKQITPELQKRGWWGVQEATDPLTGQRGLVKLGSPRRLQTIYEANLRTARAAGQWERILRTATTHPYLLYQLGPSARHRPQHVAWSGTLLPIEDEFWRYAMPPNGWGCKCWTRQVSQVEYGRLRDNGYQDPLAPMEIGDNGLPTGRRVQQLLPVKLESPKLTWRNWVNKRTGEVERVPDGIDPGWDTNPGQVARRQALAQEFMQSVARAPAAAGAAAMSETLPVIAKDLDHAYKEWADAAASGQLGVQSDMRTIGAMTPKVVQGLTKEARFTPATAGVSIEHQDLVKLLSGAAEGHEPLTIGQVRNLVHSLSNAAVLLDNRARTQTPSLLYVFDIGDRRLGFVRVQTDVTRNGVQVNAITSGGVFPADRLVGPGLVPLDGRDAL